MELNWCERLKFGIKQFVKDQISTVKRKRSWRFERSPFVVTFRLDHENDVSSVSPLSSFSDQITKMTFRALALRRNLPIRLRRWHFELYRFVRTNAAVWRLEAKKWKICPQGLTQSTQLENSWSHVVGLDENSCEMFKMKNVCARQA